MSKITAPWTGQQVDALNRFQRAGFVHELTCANDHGELDRTLIATVNGWICPHCDYRQQWAHDFMTASLCMSIRHDPPAPSSGPAVFASLGGFTCSICAPNTMTVSDVEAFAASQFPGEWSSPNPCNIEPDQRTHWFMSRRDI